MIADSKKLTWLDRTGKVYSIIMSVGTRRSEPVESGFNKVGVLFHYLFYLFSVEYIFIYICFNLTAILLFIFRFLSISFTLFCFTSIQLRFDR